HREIGIELPGDNANRHERGEVLHRGDEQARAHRIDAPRVACEPAQRIANGATSVEKKRQALKPMKKVGSQIVHEALTSDCPRPARTDIERVVKSPEEK